MILSDSLPILTSPSIPEGYALHSGLPPVEEYLNLRKVAGLFPKTPGQAAPLAINSWYGVYVSSPAGEPVAMGRIISDGGWYFHIADMATLPEHQKRGLGAAILEELLARIRHHTRDFGGAPYVTLMADPPGRKLYEKHGFELSVRSLGMVLKTDS